MQVNNATGTDSTSPMTSATQGPALGKDDFLKLLVGQLKNQNPLDPSGSEDFIQQMTMFSTLEQVTNMALSNEQTNDALAASQAVALIGRTVRYTASDGSSVEGVVEQVTFGEDGQPKLTVGGQAGIDPKAVTEVR